MTEPQILVTHSAASTLKLTRDSSGSETALSNVIERLQTASRDLDAALARIGYEQINRRGRLLTVASDVACAAEILGVLHEEARGAFAKQFAKYARDPVLKILRDPKYIGDDKALIKAWTAAMMKQGRRMAAGGEAAMARKRAEMDKVSRPTRRLSIGYKSFFIFVRAYQDAIYCLLNGSSAGSMSAVLKNEANPIRAILDERLPDYVEWFRAFKNRRDRIKYGYAGAMSGIGAERGSGDLGLILESHSDGQVIFHLKDATEALVMSMKVTELTRLHFGPAQPAS